MTNHSQRTPYDDIRDLVAGMPGAREDAAQAVRVQMSAMADGPLGRLDDIALWLAAWQGRAPRVEQALLAMFASTHGLAARGASAADPIEAARRRVAHFQAGTAPVNRLCQEHGATLKIFELALELPTADIVEADALGEAGCAATIAYGMEAVAEPVDLLAVVHAEAGSTMVAAAVVHALAGGQAAERVPEAGEVVTAALARHMRDHGASADPLTILGSLGGRDMAAMTGAIIAARFAGIPVVIDGYGATAAAAVLHAMNPASLDHCLFAQCAAGSPQARLLARLGKTALFDLDIAHGEGVCAALAIGLARSALLARAQR